MRESERMKMKESERMKMREREDEREKLCSDCNKSITGFLHIQISERRKNFRERKNGRERERERNWSWLDTLDCETKSFPLF